MVTEWVFDGGRPCLHLVNTMRDRYRGGRELLVDPAALAEWLGLLTGGERFRADTAQLVTARALREAVDRTVRAVPAGSRPAPADIRTINTAAAAAAPPQLCVDVAGRARRRTRPADPVAAALATLAVDAIELVTDGSAAVRVCAADDCGLRFADVSPQRNRQWCSMARCGNRAKARAHYARHRSR